MAETQACIIVTDLPAFESILSVHTLGSYTRYLAVDQPFPRITEMSTSTEKMSSASSLASSVAPQEYYLEKDSLSRKATRETVISHIIERLELKPQNSAFKLEEDRLELELNGAEFSHLDRELVTFEPHQDPRFWPLWKKVYVVIFVSMYTLISPMSLSILSPAMKEVSADFGITLPVIQAMVISIHILAWAIGPLFISALSENDKLGRKRVLSALCWLLLAFNIGCALSKNTTQLLVFRFVSGLFSATPLNVSPAVVSDLFDAKHRNVSLTGVFLVPFIGPAVAPVIGGYICQARGWRWVLWTLCIVNGSIAFLGSFMYLETYAPALLRKKAIKLRKETGNENWHTIHELSNKETLAESMWTSVKRPIIMLFTNPLVIGLGSFMAFIYGFLYLMIVTIPQVCEKTYNFSGATLGLMYLALGAGFIVGMIVWTPATGIVYTKLNEKYGVKPEHRLPCIFPTAIIIPAGLLWYGWLAERKLPWIMPALGSGLFAFGLFCVFQTLQAYLIDMNPAYAASLISAAAIFRFLLGFGFPLFAPSMYETLGYGWGNTLCAIIAFALGLPFPVLCFKYGARLRAWADKRMQPDQERVRQRTIRRLRRDTM